MISIANDNFDISQESAANEYQISARTLRRYELPHRRRGRQVFYRRGDIEAAIAERAATARNGVQHDDAMQAVRGEKPPGNMFRKLAFMVAGRVLDSIETIVGRDWQALDWQKEHGVSAEAAATVLSRSAVLAKHAAEHYLRAELDRDFINETGQSLDEALSAMTGLRVKSKPPAANIFAQGTPFAPTFQAVADQAMAYQEARAKANG